MAGKLRLPGRAILAGVAALALPAMLELVTRADLSWALLAILALLPVLLAAAGCSKVICSRALVFPHTLRALSATYTFVFAAVVLAGVLITPYSAYGVWFETLRDGEPHGVVSTLIVLVGAVFSSWLGRRMIEGELLLPLYGELLVAAGLLALVRQTPRLQIGLLCLLGLGAVVLSVRFVHGRDRLRNLGTLLFLFLVVASVSGLPLLSARPRGSRIVDERLHPGLRQAVVALFPRFPLLYGIPGFGYGFESKRLGGTPILSDAPVFEVEGGRGETLYLRTATYDTYDGRSWSRSPAEAANSSWV